ncbi:TPA: hypothetical protein ACIRVA_006320, partial [Klebsiella variicola]|uniref:hypothetical protein n=1 Tax=Klebsiella TaxID=570 RepID=UPI001CCC2DC3
EFATHRIFLRSLADSRNLCSVNEKTTRQGGFFEGSLTGKFLNRGNWLSQSTETELVLTV